MRRASDVSASSSSSSTSCSLDNVRNALRSLLAVDWDDAKMNRFIAGLRANSIDPGNPRHYPLVLNFHQFYVDEGSSARGRSSSQGSSGGRPQKAERAGASKEIRYRLPRAPKRNDNSSNRSCSDDHSDAALSSAKPSKAVLQETLRHKLERTLVKIQTREIQGGADPDLNDLAESMDESFRALKTALHPLRALDPAVWAVIFDLFNAAARLSRNEGRGSPTLILHGVGQAFSFMPHCAHPADCAQLILLLAKFKKEHVHQLGPDHGHVLDSMNKSFLAFVQSRPTTPSDQRAMLLGQAARAIRSYVTKFSPSSQACRDILAIGLPFLQRDGLRQLLEEVAFDCAADLKQAVILELSSKSEEISVHSNQGNTGRAVDLFFRALTIVAELNLINDERIQAAALDCYLRLSDDGRRQGEEVLGPRAFGLVKDFLLFDRGDAKAPD